MNRRRRFFAWVACLIFTCLFLSGVSTADERINFEKQVAPIFERHCIRCHLPGNKKGDISLATIGDLKANEYVIGGDVDGSYLIELVTEVDSEPPAMPKEGKPLSEQDLKQSGLLDETIVLRTTEFGRMPSTQGSKGRDHNPYVFTNWLAGGGVKGGMTHGESDQWGYKPLDRSSPTQVYDIHATILHLLGITTRD